MAKLPRITNKLYGSDIALADIGQFGSAASGDYLNTKDIKEIQALEAWKKGWNKATMSNNGYPTRQERNGLDYSLSYQIDYLLREGWPEYDAETEYNKGSIVKVREDDKVAAYESLIDNNIGIPVTNTVSWKKVNLGGGSAKIGDIGFAPYVDETTNERRRLNGQVLIKDQYPAFVTWLTNLQATTPSLFTTEDEWQAIKTASKLGQCGKFVIGNTTVRLPQVVNINGLVDMSNAGLIKDESLPDPNSKLYSVWGGGTGTSGNQSIIAQNYSGSIQSTPATGHTYIKVDNPTYHDNAPVQQEAIQYPYYITVNTGSETTEPTINDYTVITSNQYGMSQYYKGTMNSGAWLRSNGQWNNKSVYEGLYNWALAQLNAGVEGFKSFTASDITDYDFVINQTKETFRLPLKNGMEGVFASRAKGDGTTIGLTDGSDTGGLASYTNGLLSGQGPNYSDPVGTSYKNGTKFLSKTVGLTTDSTKSGIVVDLTVLSGYNLYYYCGNVEENPQLVNVARIEEALVDKVDVANTQWATNACTPDYTAGIALTSATLQGFVAPSDGVITGAINWESSTKYLKVNGYDVLGGYTETSSVYIRLAKGDKLSYDSGVVEASITRLHFYPLKGANNV